MSNLIPVVNSKRWLTLADLPGEEWRCLTEIDDRLSVSNFGRVKRDRICLEYKQGGSIAHREREAKVLFCGDNGHGYRVVSFLGRKYYVHRLVASAFCPNPKNLPCVDHINGNNGDNTAWNLRWVTHKENQHNLITELRLKNASLRHRRPVVQLRGDGTFLREWTGLTEAAEGIGCSLGTLSCALSGRTKTANGFIFVYKDKYDPNADYSLTYKIDTTGAAKTISPLGYVEFQDGVVKNYFGTTREAANHYGVDFYKFKGTYYRIHNGAPVGVRKKFNFPLDLVRLKDLGPNEYQSAVVQIRKMLYE